MTDAVRFLSQNVDYLGFLQTKLRDLRGIATLTYELVQNADDVRTEQGEPGATLIRLDVRDDALIVENDGVFRPQDFERIQTIASGGKRDELETTGAFGIGFISVYQVTDSPEIFSSGQHWRIRPDAAEDQRIEVRDTQVSGTRFRLPWAFDPMTTARQKLRLEAVDRDRLTGYAVQIGEALSGAALFLRQLRQLEVCRNGVSIRRILREPAENEQMLVQDNTALNAWKILRGNFDQQAADLRRRYGLHIEAKRRSQVQVALPYGELIEGRLFAVLPSETNIPLPLHINADFYPTSDRKRIIFGQDYQSEWNTAAIRAATNALNEAFDELPQLLGHDRLWDLIERMSASRSDSVFGIFWQVLSPTWRRRKIVFTADKSWRLPEEVRYPDSDAEQTATEVLQSLGIALVHPELRPCRNLMVEQKNLIGLQLLAVADVAAALRHAGLTQPIPLEKMPPALRRIENWRLLWQALEDLAKPLTPAKLLATLEGCAIAPNEAGYWHPLVQVFRGDNETRALFPQVNWLEASENDRTLFVELAPAFGPGEALTELEHLSPDQIEQSWRASVLNLPALYDWFLLRKSFWLSEDQLRDRLRALPIWPTGAGLRSLEGRYIAGGFNDPFRLDSLLDLTGFQGKTDLLTELGVQRLDFATYAREELPKVFSRHPDLPAAERQKLVEILSEQLSTLVNNPELCRQLGKLPLIHCDDDEFRPANEVYTSTEVRAILGQSVHVAADRGSPALQSLLAYLGARPVPRPGDIIQRVKTVTATPLTQAAYATIQSVFEFLVSNWTNFDERARQDYALLQTFAWLPSESDTDWHKPEQIYTTDQKYLFETQGIFLAFPSQLQRRASTVKLIDFLGVPVAPPLELVARHLLKCSDEGQPINLAVYRTLNDNAGEAVIRELIGTHCLLLSDGSYVAPQQVFWGEHHLHPFRHQLSPDWRLYNALCKALGVREMPKDHDYIEVLLELAEQFGDRKQPLDQLAYDVLMHCWQQLRAALLEGRLASSDLDALRNRRVIPDQRGMLTVPAQVFFEDRPGLAAKFGSFFANDVIERPQGAWQAMQTVGVKLLLGQKVVEIKLAELENESPDNTLQARLTERLSLVARVVETDSDARDVDELRALRFTRADRLEIQYETQAFNRRETTPPEAVPAWRLEDEVLVTYADRHVPWAAIARELAYVLKPFGEIGGLASGLHNALEPATFSDAQQTLDQLGYPPLRAWTGPTSAPDRQLMGIGGTELEEVDEEKPTGPPLTPANTESLEAIPASGPTSTPSQPISPPSAPASLDSTQKPEKPEVAQDLDETEGAPQPTSGHTTGDNRKPTSSGSRGKLRTYVVPEGASSDEQPDTTAARRRSEVDRAGVDRVLAHERLQGREPTEKDHFNEGYDIESLAEDGSMRYIEVKSLSGAWSERNAAGLTHPQFNLAKIEKTNYWLYVVEFAQDHEKFRISRIQNPATRVTQFLFDDGWRALREVEPDEVA